MTDSTQPVRNPPAIETEAVDGIQIVRFRNARILTDACVGELGKHLDHCLKARQGPPRLVVSFAGVNFFSSAGIGKLITAQRKAREHGGDLKLCDLNLTAIDVFRVAHLQDYFKIHPDLNSALAEFAALP